MGTQFRTIERIIRSFEYKPGYALVATAIFQDPDQPPRAQPFDQEMALRWDTSSAHHSTLDFSVRLYLTLKADLLDAEENDGRTKLTVALSREFSMQELEFMQESVERVFKAALYKLVLDMEKHEIKEWMRFDGKRYEEPHPNRIDDCVQMGGRWNELH